jgi:hypothetical protein
MFLLAQKRGGFYATTSIMQGLEWLRLGSVLVERDFVTEAVLYTCEE